MKLLKTCLLLFTLFSTLFVLSSCEEEEPEPPISVSIVSSSSTRTEGQPTSILINLNRTPDSPVTVEFAFSGASQRDYSTPNGTTLVIPAGELTGEFEVEITDDALFEPEEETLTVQVLRVTENGEIVPQTQDASITFNLRDNDTPTALPFNALLSVDATWASVEGSSNDIDLYLYRDNQDGTYTFVGSSTEGGNTFERLLFTSLTDGTYVIALRLFRGSSLLESNDIIEVTTAVQVINSADITVFNDELKLEDESGGIGSSFTATLTASLTKSGNSFTITDTAPIKVAL